MACLAAEPVVNGLKTEFAGQLTVLQVDVATSAGKEISAQFNAFGTPTFIFFDADGKEVWRTIGALDPYKVRASLP
jgi:thioredoxin-related protein